MRRRENIASERIAIRMIPIVALMRTGSWTPILIFLLVLLSIAWPQTRRREYTPSTLAIPPPSPHGAKGVTYEDVAFSSGLSEFRHRSGDPLKPYLPDTTGSGVALLDYNNDGWLDIYLVNSLSHRARKGEEEPLASTLFRNNKDGRFTNVTTEAGVGNKRWGTGVCAGDFNNDGWEDLCVVNFGKTRLFRNNGDGTFSDIAEDAGLEVNQWSTGCAFGDYNGDGLLDLYVAGYVDFDWQNPPPPGESSQSPATTDSTGPAFQNPSGKQGGMAGAAYEPGLPFCTYLGMRVACGPLGLKGAPDFLFRNNGDETFSAATREAALMDTERHYGFSVAWVDLDDDGHQDIVVANDSRPNLVYHNQGDGTFEEIGMLSGLATNAHGRAQAYMGMAVGDYDHDGRNDFFFTTFSNDSYTLHHNNGDLDFDDLTESTGLGVVTIPFLGWAAEFLDYDNDGWLDILAANGHVYPQLNRHSRFTSYKQRTFLFRNLHNGRFTDVTGSLGTDVGRPASARGAAVGDLFNDGDLDIVINNLDGPPTLLRNRGGNRAGHWVGLRLVGNPSLRTPRDAIGTVVFCDAGGFRQRGEVASGRGYISQSDLRIHFGLGDAETIDKLEIRWSNGTREVLKLPAVDRLYTILQGKGIQ